ncbi:MAG: cytochrome c oxidase subunit 3 [Kofleriaceae bacterium]
MIHPPRAHGLRIAMWIVIASEALLFAGLFALYAAYHVEYHAKFAEASELNVRWMGSLNTFVLLTSSFAMAWSIHALRDGRVRVAKRALLVVLALGGAFLVIKGIEWGLHIHEGIVPGAGYAGPIPAHGAVLFFDLYYGMTGLHAAHVIAGMVLVGWVALMVHRADDRGPVIGELVGLYWHFVDVIWVFLWPMFYLLR